MEKNRMATSTTKKGGLRQVDRPPAGTLRFEIYNAKRIAKQLCYPVSVLESLDNAKDPNEIQRILHDARMAAM